MPASVPPSTPAVTGSASTIPAADPPAWRRAELALLVVAVLSLVTLLISVNHLWSGLPAHPLFIHVPVILIPLAIVGALAVTARPEWFERYGVLLCLIAIAGMSSVFLAENAGGQLQTDLHLQNASIVNQHASAANTLAILFAAFTACLLLGFASHRVSTGMTWAVGPVDSTLAHPGVRVALRGLLVVLALVCAYYVYRVGDLGAKAVWLQHGG